MFYIIFWHLFTRLNNPGMTLLVYRVWSITHSCFINSYIITILEGWRGIFAYGLIHSFTYSHFVTISFLFLTISSQVQNLTTHADRCQHVHCKISFNTRGLCVHPLCHWTPADVHRRKRTPKDAHLFTRNVSPSTEQLSLSRVTKTSSPHNISLSFLF